MEALERDIGDKYSKYLLNSNEFRFRFAELLKEATTPLGKLRMYFQVGDRLLDRAVSGSGGTESGEFL